MAKHRKTRQQKLVADQRHLTYHLNTASAEEYKPTEKEIQSSYKSNYPDHKSHIATYAYVNQDLRKTGLVTGAIVITQIILFIVLNRI